MHRTLVISTAIVSIKMMHLKCFPFVARTHTHRTKSLCMCTWIL